MIFETTDIKIGAVILSEMPNAYFIGLNGRENKNGKKILKIEHPVDQEAACKRLVRSYEERSQSVNLYRYNKALSLLRDAVLTEEKRETRNETMEVRSGKS